jgi:hypothetical protein
VQQNQNKALYIADEWRLRFTVYFLRPAKADSGSLSIICQNI